MNTGNYCSHMCVFIYVQVHMCTCVWRTLVWFLRLLNLVFDTQSVADPELTDEILLLMRPQRSSSLRLIQAPHSSWIFLREFRVLNSGPYACKATVLLTEFSLKPLATLFQTSIFFPMRPWNMLPYPFANSLVLVLLL